MQTINSVSKYKSFYRTGQQTIQREAKQHNHNFEVFYKDMIRECIKLNRQAETNIGIKQHNFSKDVLYGDIITLFETPYDDNRTLSIRWLKIPTFSKNNQQRYTLIALCNIDYFYPEDFHQISALCRTQTAHKETPLDEATTYGDSFFIFLTGKLKGKNHPGNVISTAAQYHIYFFNIINILKGTKLSTSGVRAKIFMNLYNAFEKKTDRMLQTIKDGRHPYLNRQIPNTIYGILNKQYDTLVDFKKKLLQWYHHYWKLHLANREEEKRMKEDTDISIYRNNDVLIEESQTQKATEQYLKLQNWFKEQDAIKNKGSTDQPGR